MQVFFGIAYLAIGLVQLFAIVDGIDAALGVGSFLSYIIAAITTYLPLIGSVAGVYGAVSVWDWSLWQALALFFWYVPFMLLMGVFSMITEHRGRGRPLRS
jgi:hypothetical protein